MGGHYFDPNLNISTSIGYLAVEFCTYIPTLPPIKLRSHTAKLNCQLLFKGKIFSPGLGCTDTVSDIEPILTQIAGLGICDNRDDLFNSVL